MKSLLFTFALLIIAVSGALALSGAGGLTGSGGGSSFAPSTPGAIGGATSSTGQFTNLAVGASVPALDGVTGDITATGKFACNTNNASCLTQADSTAVQRSLVNLDLNNFEQIGGTGVLQIVATASNNFTVINGGVQVFSTSLTSVNIKNGTALQSAGGVVPTATCSGGATGVVVSAGNTSCTASVTPFPCCTGSGTGTCSAATNNRGLILTSSSASTNCTITWSGSGAWGQAPGCVFTDGSASITPVAFAEGNCGTATCVFDFASATSKVVQWICM